MIYGVRLGVIVELAVHSGGRPVARLDRIDDDPNEHLFAVEILEARGRRRNAYRVWAKAACGGA